jgi:hypothetical protein
MTNGNMPRNISLRGVLVPDFLGKLLGIFGIVKLRPFTFIKNPPFLSKGTGDCIKLKILID